MLIAFIRAIFILAVAGLAARMAQMLAGRGITPPLTVFVGAMVAAVVVVVIDLLFPRKRIQTISAVYFGATVGLLLSSLLQTALQPALESFAIVGSVDLRPPILGVVTVAVCYMCISMILQTKDDFRFIIPYMEFSKEIKGARPLLLDTSVIIDGRIADVAESRVLDQTLIIPRFVLQELQAVADSGDKLRRNRGRRGLDVLQRLQKMPGIEVRLHESEPPELAGVAEVDQRLVLLARHLGGKVVTNDYNLNKIAKLQGVDVINLNDLANALKPVVLPGEGLTVKLIRRGEEPGQGVGYLDDGTMVVVEQGVHHLGDLVRMQVTSVLQTSAGRMIFGRMDGLVGPGEPGASRRSGIIPPGPRNAPSPPPPAPDASDRGRPSD